MTLIRVPPISYDARDYLNLPTQNTYKVLNTTNSIIDLEPKMAIIYKDTDVEANQTTMKVVINDGQYPEALGMLFKSIEEINEKLQADINPCNDCETAECRDCPHEEEILAQIADEVEKDMYEERQVMIQEMGSEGIFDAEHDSSLELKHQHLSDSIEEPELDYSTDEEQDRRMERQADSPYRQGFDEEFA